MNENFSDVFYLNLRQFNVPVLQMFVGPENYAKVSPYIGKWIKFDFKEIEKFAKEQGNGSFSFDSYKQQASLAQNKLEDPAVLVKLQKAFVDSHALKFVSKTNAKTAESVDVVKYKFVVDKAGLKKLLISGGQIMGTPVGASDAKRFDAEVKQTYLPSGEIWLGVKDGLVYRLVLNSNITIPATKTAGKTTMIASLTAGFKDYNKPIVLVAPSPVQSILDIIKPYLEKSMMVPNNAMVPPGKNPAVDTVGMSVLSSSRLLAEIFYSKNNSYSGFCLDRELMTLLKKISSSVCNIASDKQAYSIATDLPSGKIFCVDSTGFAGVISLFPWGKTSCQ